MARTDEILERIRVRAYFLWEQAGRPEGGDLEFWERAKEQIERELGMPGPDDADLGDTRPGSEGPAQDAA